MAQPLPTLAESAGRYVEHNIETLRQLEAYPTDQVPAASISISINNTSHTSAHGEFCSEQLCRALPGQPIFGS